MKVIQGPKPKKPEPPWKATRVMCRKHEPESPKDGKPCGAVYEAEEADLILMYWIGNFGGRHWYAATKCPCCGKINPLPEGKQPKDAAWERLCARQKKPKFDGFDARV